MDPITADRPDQSESPSVTPKGWLQAEFGFGIEQAGKNNSNFSYPASLFKYGLGHRIDLRLIAEAGTEKNGYARSAGMEEVAAGFRVNFCDEKGLLPKTSLLADIRLPFASSKNFRSSFYAPAFRFAMVNTLSKKISLSYNLGAEWPDEITTPVYIYTLSAGISVTGKISTYLELYGFLPQHDVADHRVDAGFCFLLNNDQQLDISFGKGLSTNYYFLAAGFSFRFRAGGR